MRYGIIDVGSNSIRLCVYQGQVDDKPIVLLHDEKIMAGLASYVQEDGCLSGGAGNPDRPLRRAGQRPLR